MADLEAQFEQEMLNIYERAKAELGYNASYFLQMVHQDGGLATAKALVNKKTVSDGYGVLAEKGRLDLTVEALVVQEPWQELFTEDELKRAQKRLK